MNKLLSLISLLLILSISAFGTPALAASHEKAEKAAEEKVAVDADGKPIKKKEETEEEEPDCD